VDRRLEVVVFLLLAVLIPLGYARAARTVAERWEVRTDARAWRVGVLSALAALVVIGVFATDSPGAAILGGLVALTVWMQTRPRGGTREPR